MATLPQHSEPMVEEIDWSKANFPERKIDDLLDQGRVELAQQELARLLDEEDDSDPGQVMDQALFDEIVAAVRAGRVAK